MGEAMHTPLAGLSVLPLRAITGLNSGDGDGAGGGRIGKGDGGGDIWVGDDAGGGADAHERLVHTKP